MPSAVPLSVVVPTYNRSGYVRDCLRALAASGLPDLDVLVSDDGSTDDTKDVVAATDPAATYLWQPNSGTPATARNAGFARSRGRYVGFLDCDDLWLPGAPAEAVRLLDAHPDVDVLFADANVGNPADGYFSWIQWAGQDDFWQLPATEPEPGFRILERRPFFRRMAVRNAVFIGACIVRRSAFEAVGGFDPKLRGAADWELWLRMADRCTFGFMTRPLAVYTRHPDNMSGDQDGMVNEFALALRNVLAKCRLSRADRLLVSGRLRHHLYGHAYLAYDRHEYAKAAGRFAAAWQAGDRRPQTAAYWLACQLPPAVVERLRGWKWAAGGGR